MRTFKTVFLLSLICLAFELQGQTALTIKEAKEDLYWLQTSLEYVHPRLYKYIEKETLDSIFDNALSVMSNSQENIAGLDFLSEVSKINAQVNCGHLYTIPQFELQKEILRKKVMPFYVKLIQDDLFIVNDCSKKGNMLNGVKILSINGKSASEILTEIRLGIATDGHIQSRKNRLIERYFYYTFHGFDLYYHLHIDRSEEFNIEYQKPEEDQIHQIDLKGIGIDERKDRLNQIYEKDEKIWQSTPSPRFELNEAENYGVLTLSRSFYNNEIDPDFDLFLKNSFQELKDKGIANLIVDLRNNEGGSEYQQMELMSYLYDKPFRLYQNIYLSHLDYRPLKEVIIERDPKDLVFNNNDEYMRKISSDLWINNYKYGKSLNVQKPKENVFNGKLFVLINGITFSSAADLAADIRKTTDATFIGEETGGVFEGPTGGNTIVIQLPNSKIMVRISPNIHIGYMYKKHPIGRGVLPDYEIEYSINSILERTDLELQKAIELIKNK
ncbi:MAG: S41 family peptidase [Bacteroidota bacterium]